MGRPPLKKGSLRKRVDITLPEDVIERAKSYAEHLRSSLSGLIEDVLEKNIPNFMEDRSSKNEKVKKRIVSSKKKKTS